MRNHRILLFQEYNKLQPRSTAPIRRLIQPSYDFSWSTFESVRFDLFIRQANGSPTAWSLKPRLQVGIRSTAGYQDTNPFWKTLTPADAAKLTQEGAWLPDLTQAATLPGLWSATILHPPASMRIDLGESGPDAFTMTGGTDPNLQIALVATGKAK